MADYIEGLNVENCNKLLEWLDAGAPHAVFDITVGNMRVIERKDDNGEIRNSWVAEQVKTKGVGDCGTVCCIAGAAAALKEGDISTPIPSVDFEVIATDHIGQTSVRRARGKIVPFPDGALLVARQKTSDPPVF